MVQPFDIFVISLEKAARRREYMRAQLEGKGVEYTFFPGVDGRNLAPDLSDAWIDDALSTAVYGKPLTPGEKGCALSHILLWEKVARRGKGALILEDDVALPKGSLRELVTPLLPELKKDRVILLRHIANSFWWKGRLRLDGVSYTLRKPNHKILMAAAYLITPLAAQKLVAFLKKHRLAHPLDWWYRPDGLGFTKVVDTWATSRELIASNYEIKSTIDAMEGDRDHLKSLSRIGWIKRQLFLATRWVLFPWMRLVRSFWFKPIQPE
ncbi:MAG: glycosyltransferase family 25 protein [Chthoniobacteraceae bacterium]|nr:glycosyltransferase family 25 protein [Chthoniobacteraceae bacterium]